MQIIKLMFTCQLYLHIVIPCSSVARADSRALGIATGSHDVYHNAEFNPSGDPIGGGAGYSRTVDVTGRNVIVVDNKEELISAITTAVSGSVIYVKDDAVIDLTHAGTIIIPGGVTLASGRGKDGSQGALLHVTQWPVAPLFKTGGPLVRITGLRIRGQTPEHGNASSGVQVVSRNCEIDNCEIYNLPYAGIDALEDAFGLIVHHNYIHHNNHNGTSYGVGLDGVDALIEANYFDHHRHGIAATGGAGTSYEVRYNVFGKNLKHYAVDMHGGGDRGDGTNDAGNWLVVHHNTFYKTDSSLGGIHISGIPRVGAWIFSNWFEKEPTVTYRIYTNPSVEEGPCDPCEGTTDLEAHRIFTFKNRVGIQQWGATLPLAPERDHVGDFNGDGLLDWITFSTNGDFTVRKRIKNGGFEASQRWGGNGDDLGDMRRYRIADFNGDGRSDVISFEANGGIYVWIAKSDDTFEDVSQWGSNGADIGAIRYKIGDFNRDRRADIVSFEPNKNFYVWLSEAGGGFQRTALWGNNGEDYGATDKYRLADVDGDDRSDVVSIEGTRFYVWKPLDNQFSAPTEWGRNGAVLDTYRYQVGNGGAGILSDVISFEANGGKYIWISNGSDAFVLWGEWFNSWSHPNTPVNVNQTPRNIRQQLVLHQNYPNPFNPETVIRFQLSQESHLMLSVYNTLGQGITTLIDSVIPAGSNSVVWDGRDDNREQVPSGVYIYRLRAENLQQSNKMILLR